MSILKLNVMRAPEMASIFDIWGLLFFGQTTKCFKLNSQLLKGEEQDDLFFVQGRDTDIQYGCSTKFRGEFWTFGGRGAQHKNQVKSGA